MPIACWKAISPAATARRYWIATTVWGRDAPGELSATFFPAEAGREQIELGRIGTARLRLDVPHRREITLELGEQRAFGATLQHLGEEAAARTEHFAREFGRGFDQRDDLQLIGFLVTRRIRCHVRQHDVGAAIERGA